jgi:phosphate transport system protein
MAESVAQIAPAAALEIELRALRHRLLLMAGYVEQMIGASVRALVSRDCDLAKRTIAVDAKVNSAEVFTDEQCMDILQRWHPEGPELRFVVFALKMVTDLERIGDLAVNICERAMDLSREPLFRAAHEDLNRMAGIVKTMVRDAIDAFVEGSADKAREVIARDDEVDELYHRAFAEMLHLMRADPANVARGVHLQSVAKWLERMADHSTNIAEQVIFMVQGTDVRHPGKLCG